MPRANRTLDQDSWLTRWWLTLLYGPNPWVWSEFAHRATGWEYWEQPDGEVVPLWKNREKINHNSGKSVQYPISMATNARTKNTYQIPTLGDAITWSTGLYMGSYNGEPVQLAKVQNGRAVTRTVSYGYSWSQDRYASVPLPESGRYLHCGDPNTANDRHSAIYDPTTSYVHELIQFDEYAVDTPFTNQALNWGIFKDGVLVDGNPVTATGNSVTAYLWDRTSYNRPHRLGLTLGDYVGADGTLTSGPQAGDVFFLSEMSESYQEMVKLGGECAAIAKAANEYGLLLIDRSGYVDSSNLNPGTKMKAPSINIQYGSWMRSTNLDRLKIKVHDLRLVI